VPSLISVGHEVTAFDRGEQENELPDPYGKIRQQSTPHSTTMLLKTRP
jgi:hypothetical protein